MKPHKHAETIKAWADGAVIECRVHDADRWSTVNEPSWVVHYQYRIKPERKPDDIYYVAFWSANGNYLPNGFKTIHNPSTDQLKLTFDGETGQLKAAEVLK